MYVHIYIYIYIYTYIHTYIHTHVSYISLVKTVSIPRISVFSLCELGSHNNNYYSNNDNNDNDNDNNNNNNNNNNDNNDNTLPHTRAIGSYGWSACEESTNYVRLSESRAQGSPLRTQELHTEHCIYTCVYIYIYIYIYMYTHSISLSLYIYYIYIYTYV